MKSIYKSEKDREKILALYDRKQQACGIACEDVWVQTAEGRTHVLVCGPPEGTPVVLLHGINAGAPLALEAMKGLEKSYRIYAVDTIGQAGKSDELRLPLKDNSFGKWLAAVMDGLGLNSASVIGVSYGAFILQKLMQYAPSKISKAIFVVPSGLVNGSPKRSFFELSIPLIRFYLTKKEKHLVRFMDAFYITKDPHSVEMQGSILTGVHMDFRRPPLLRASDVKDLEAPVYGIFAGDDIFFPGDKALEKCRLYFRNFREGYMMPHARHIPDVSDYPLIASKIGDWLRE